MLPREMTVSIDAATAVLYGGPLDGFVAARDAMAKEIRAAGDRGLANDIKALRKPTVAADALNRAIRQDPDAVEGLLAAVDRLRVTQETMLSGDTDPDEPVDFAADQRTYRDAVEAVAGNAPSNEIEVRAAIEVAAVGGLADELRAAAFATLPEPTGGFGPFAAGTGSLAQGRPDRGAARRNRPGTGGGRSAAGDEAGGGDVTTGSDEGGRGTTGARRPSAAERRLAQRVRRAAEQAVATAEDELAVAGEAATTAGDRVTELDEELADLERRIGETRSARDDAVATRAAAEASRTTIAGLLDEARAALDGLPDPDGDQESG